MNGAPYALDPERARKNQAAILSRLSSVGQVNIAEAVGVSEPLISKLKAKEGNQKFSDVELFSRVIAACGLKIVPAEKECYTPEYMQSLRYLARLRLNDPTAPTEDDPE